MTDKFTERFLAITASVGSLVVLEVNSKVISIKRSSQNPNNIRALLAASLIWLLSGTPVQTIGIGTDGWLVLGFFLQLLICVRSNVRSVQAGAPVAGAVFLYGCWTFGAAIAGIQGQLIGLFGQIIKLAIVLLPVIFLMGVRQGLVRSMEFVCKISLVIFCIRQIGLLGGFDIANIFQPVYTLTGIPNDRTIFLFNFDVPEEAGRNSGPFREPGMFAANIVIATLLLLSLRDELTASKLWRLLLLFGTTLLTTQSTMGFVTLPFLSLWALSIYVRSTAIRVLMIPLLVSVIVALVALGGTNQVGKVQQQIGRLETQDNRWYSSRFGNAYIDYMAIVERPLIGYGFSEEGRPRLENIKDDVREFGLGNGLTGTIVKHGLILSLLIYLLFLWRCIRLYGDVMLGFVAWIILALILFSQQLLLMPAVFTMMGSYQTRRRLVRQTPLLGPEGTAPLLQDVAT
jgi:hypothetical protein